MRPLFLYAALMVFTSACGDPCKTLSNQVCNCEPSDLGRRQCMQRVSRLVGQNATTAEERSTCADRLDECTCAQLRAGALDRCGLSVEPPR